MELLQYIMAANHGLLEKGEVFVECARPHPREG